MTKDNYKDHVYALILAGGGGTRLWPRSRNKTPKQFLKLFKGRTLTQITSYRFRKMLPWKRIYCVTVSEYYKKEILKEVPEFVAENIIVEPARLDNMARSFLVCNLFFGIWNLFVIYFFGIWNFSISTGGKIISDSRP